MEITKTNKRLTSTLSTRVGELEETILSFGSDKNNLSKSDFIRFLILQYGKNFAKEQLEEKYYNYLEEYNILLQKLKVKNELKNNLLKNSKINECCQLESELVDIKDEIKHLTTYLKQYINIFEN